MCMIPFGVYVCVGVGSGHFKEESGGKKSLSPNLFFIQASFLHLILNRKRRRLVPVLKYEPLIQRIK